MQPVQSFDTEEVIAAIASASGASPRGIIRISGEATVSLLDQFLASVDPQPSFHPTQARRYVCQYPFGAQQAPLEIAVHLWPTSRSYTGQPSAELHTLGSPPILEAILSRLHELGARPARPGEFTLRSFLTGKVSLVQAEAVLGVIDAESEQQLDLALTQLAGGISSRMRKMRDQLIEDLADLEAGLDFVDEDIDFVDRTEFQKRLVKMSGELQLLSDSADNRMLNRSRFRVALAGLPNAGKSTLFNELTESTALVSDIPGTTTDYLVGSAQWDNLTIDFHDTAGWEDSLTEISSEAQQKRIEEYQWADLIVWCTPANLSEQDLVVDEQHFAELAAAVPHVMRIVTKGDYLSQYGQQFSAAEVCLSVPDGIGLNHFQKLLTVRLLEQNSGRDELLNSTASRCRDSLSRAHSHLQAAVQLATAGYGDELIAEEIRGVLQELGTILGHVYTDDLLDRVFSKFCIGK